MSIKSVLLGMLGAAALMEQGEKYQMSRAPFEGKREMLQFTSKGVRFRTYGLGRNQRKIRKRLRQVPQLRRSKKYRSYNKK